MTYLVILLPTDFRMNNLQPQAFGPYATPEEAERARRRVHFDAQREVQPWQDFSNRVPRTYVVEQESPR